MPNLPLKAVLTAALTALATASEGATQFALYSNLSRDTLVRPNGVNPDFMFVDMSWLHVDTLYAAMPVYEAVCSTPGQARCWRASAGAAPFIGVSSGGKVTVQPGSNKAAIVRWKNVVGGKVRMLAYFSDVDSACGNGVDWYVDNGPFTVASGHLQNTGPGAGTAVSRSFINMIPTAPIYLIITPGANQDSACDATEVDVMFTEQF